jgi:hypothetical protein
VVGVVWTGAAASAVGGRWAVGGAGGRLAGRRRPRRDVEEVGDGRHRGGRRWTARRRVKTDGAEAKGERELDDAQGRTLW